MFTVGCPSVRYDEIWDLSLFDINKVHMAFKI